VPARSSRASTARTRRASLFERFGFVEAARLTDVGRKFERWRTQLLLLKNY
jgi:L-amino acid N-acyltransferase YncA